MQMLSHNPAAAYRRVELDARIEAAGAADLTRICLEEAHTALGRALIALGRPAPGHGRVIAGSYAGHAPLVRAQTIMLWLARSVAPEHPLHASLTTFYGGLAAQIGANVLHPEAGALERIRSDINDLIAAAG
jgi:hypothetical protein